MAEATKSYVNDFDLLQQEVKKALGEAVLAEQISPVEVIAYLELFSNAQSVVQMWMLITTVQDKIPTLQKLVNEANQLGNDQAAKVVEDLLKKVIKDQPKLAADISAAVNDERLSLKQLQNRFPEISSYLN